MILVLSEMRISRCNLQIRFLSLISRQECLPYNNLSDPNPRRHSLKLQVLLNLKTYKNQYRSQVTKIIHLIYSTNNLPNEIRLHMNNKFLLSNLIGMTTHLRVGISFSTTFNKIRILILNQVSSKTIVWTFLLQLVQVLSRMNRPNSKSLSRV